MCQQDREFFIRHTGELLCIDPKIFCVYEHGMLYALEINSNEGSKREHVESSPSTTTKITSPIPQCHQNYHVGFSHIKIT